MEIYLKVGYKWQPFTINRWNKKELEKRCIRIGEKVRIGKNLRIGNECVIGNKCSIGDNVTIKGNSVICHDTCIGNNVIIGKNCNIFEHCFIGHNAIIGNNCEIKNDCTINSKCKLGDDCTVDAYTHIDYSWLDIVGSKYNVTQVTDGFKIKIGCKVLSIEEWEDKMEHFAIKYEVKHLLPEYKHYLQLAKILREVKKEIN